jgi:aryl-alcohol dehydrogenase-like predicted oxidoreductase
LRQVTLGKTGASVGVIGFGGMPLSTAGRPSESDAVKVVHAALDGGVNLIDTADVYCIDESDIGHNERLIASAVRSRSDDTTVRIATKGGFRRPAGEWVADGSPKHLREACEASRRALGVDSIFLYQLHMPDPKVEFRRSVETLAELQREGKVEHVGLSNVSVEQIAQAVEVVPVTSVQNRLNVYFREALESGVVDECGRRGITFLAYSPVGGGRLARKIPEFPILKSLSERYGASPHAVALAWVRSKGEHVVPIPGARRIESAIDSAASADLLLDAEDLAAIDESEFSRA